MDNVNLAWFSSASDEWATPQNFFDKLNSEFNFTLDVCATDDNYKCNNYYTIQNNGLAQDWIGNVWMNPPYGKQIPFWLEKAHKEIQKNANLIVVLVPARTDTKWFHNFLYNKPNIELRFIKGRIRFISPYRTKNSPMFPSLIAIFRKHENES